MIRRLDKKNLKKLKLLIVTGTFPYETFISNKIKHLLSTNDVYIFCSVFNKIAFEKDFLHHQNLKIICPPHIQIFIASNFKKYILRHTKAKQELLNAYLIRYSKKINPDITHFEFSGVANYYTKAVLKIKGRKIISCRGSNENIRALVNSELQKSLQNLFKHVDKIHCVSLFTKKNISGYCDNVEKIFINYPAVNTNYFLPKKSRSSEKNIILLSVARLIFQKGLLTGILAFKKVFKHNKELKWLIVGDGPLKTELLFYIHNMDLQNNIVLMESKSQEQLVELYENAAIFFLPSISEGIANVALEAMSMELPVVSTKAGGMEEVITHGVNGLLAEVYDHDQLAEHILLLAQNAEMRKKLGLAARKHVSENFHIHRQINIFENVYQELAAQKITE